MLGNRYICVGLTGTRGFMPASAPSGADVCFSPRSVAPGAREGARTSAKRRPRARPTAPQDGWWACRLGILAILRQSAKLRPSPDRPLQIGQNIYIEAPAPFALILRTRTDQVTTGPEVPRNGNRTGIDRAAVTVIFHGVQAHAVHQLRAPTGHRIVDAKALDR